MTKDDIIKLAREAGLFTHKEAQPEILAFANLVAAHKTEVALAEAYWRCYRAGMEAAAVICENVDKSTHPADLAAAIRARGNT
jgi:hypothetical protein